MSSQSTEIKKLFILWENQLLKEFDQINWVYKLKLSRPAFTIVEYESYLGQWDPLKHEIRISSYLIRKYPWFVIQEVLKHEMAHQYCTEIWRQDAGHGPDFQKACEILSVETAFRRSEADFDLDSYSSKKNSLDQDKTHTSEEIKILQRVEKLLSLAQSGNEHEALLAMEKVSSLFERHNIDRIQQRQKSEYTYLLINLNRKRVEATQSIITKILQEFYFVEPILCTTYLALSDETVKAIELMGTTENVLMAEYVFHFLDQQIDLLWKNYQQSHKVSLKFKRSYQVGLLNGFHQKLQLSKKQRQFEQMQESKLNNETKQIILNKDLQLVSYVEARYPRLRKHSTGRGRLYSEAYQQGQSDGHKIIINKGVSSSSQATGKFLLNFKLK